MTGQTPAEEFDHFSGLLQTPPDPLRYDYPPDGPEEAHGLLMNWVPVGASVLDVGAGSGTFAQLIKRERQADVTCIEPDARRSETARSRGLNVFTGNVEEFGATATRTYDVAVLADVIEHLMYAAPILKSIRPLLGKQGHLIVSVPNAAHWTIRTALMRGRFDYDVTGLMDATHLRWYTLESLRRLLTASGYVVENQAGSMGAMLAPYTRAPWTFLPQRYRFGVLRRLIRFYPGVFALQHVLRARPSGQ